MTIKTSRYNEVSPKEIKRLVEAGAKIIKDYENESVGVLITLIDNTKVLSTDSIKIKNVILPLAKAEDDYFDSFVEIN